MENHFALLKEHIAKNPRDFGDGESVLDILYECYSESRPYDNAQIKADFGALYQAMNGTPLMEMDKIIDLSAISAGTMRKPLFLTAFGLVFFWNRNCQETDKRR